MITTKDKKLIIYEYLANAQSDEVINKIFDLIIQPNNFTDEELTPQEKKMIDSRLQSLKERGENVGISYEELRAKIKKQYGI